MTFSSPMSASPEGGHDVATPSDSLGLSFLTRTMFDGVDVQAVSDSLVARYTANAEDYGALHDLSVLWQLTGDREKGLGLLAAAVAGQTVYRCVHGAGDGLRILVFQTPGDLMANTPIDFLLDGSDAVLLTCYVTGDAPSPEDLPAHDLAFLGVGESVDHADVLARLGAALRTWPRPVVNRRADQIADLTRDGVAARFADDRHVLAPPTRRMSRAEVQVWAEAAGGAPVGLAFPVIIRPIGSHAGQGLLKLDERSDLAAYLADHDEAEFFVSSFIDYRGADGRFRKLRIVFIRGRAFISHMAVSARWMVHYLNADMAEDEGNRADEARMMRTFDEGFAARHAEAFDSLCRTIGLDYFGIDCAETADGRLLLFEADTAMIVHAMDPVGAYPYKRPAMQKLFDGFTGALAQIADGAPLA